MPLSIYIHIPFCVSRCAYCDFNTYAGMESLMPAYVDAIEREIDQVARGLESVEADRRTSDPAGAHTVFFGGGTPSLLPPESIEQILGAVRGSFDLEPDSEITLEANPATLDRQDLERLRRAGVNRLSLGAQSARPDELRLLERAHTFDDVRKSVRQARQAGFDNLNLDLIFGLPRQRTDEWLDSLEQTLELAPEHLSLYALSLENGTPLRAWVDRGLVASPDPDAAAEMYEAADRALEGAGFVQYEISNWALDGRSGGETGLPHFACRHNVQYWRNLPYLGIGAGAHGSALGWRYANVLSPQAFIDRVRAVRPAKAPCSSAAAERSLVGREQEMDETMMLGFRLTREGIRPSVFRSRFGLPAEERYGRPLRRLEGDGLIERLPDGLRLTKRGRLLGNRVFGAFV